MKKIKTVGDAIADGTYEAEMERLMTPSLRAGLARIARVTKGQEKEMSLIRADVPAGDALNLLEEVQRGKAFKPRGKGTSPLHKMIVRNLNAQATKRFGKVTHTAIDIWWELKNQSSGQWSFDGDPAGVFCEIWYQDKRVCASFQAFQNLLSKARKTLKK